MSSMSRHEGDKFSVDGLSFDPWISTAGRVGGCFSLPAARGRVVVSDFFLFGHNTPAILLKLKSE